MTNGWGGVREGAGRPRTSPDGQLRKQRQTRASDDEWEMIKTARAARMMKTE